MQILFNLRYAGVINFNALIIFIAYFKKFTQTGRNALDVDSVEYIRGRIAVAPQIFGRYCEVARLKISRQNIERKPVVYVLNYAVDSARQFILFIELLQASEMSLVLVAAQRVLNIFCNRRIHVFVRRLAVGKDGAVIIYSAQAHCAAVLDVFVNSLNAQHLFKFAIGDKGGVQHYATVVQLFVFGKNKSERVRAR